MKHDKNKIYESLNKFDNNQRKFLGGLIHSTEFNTWFINELKEYSEHMVQQERERIVEIIKDNFEEENPMEDGVPVETYGYEIHRNQGFKEIINLINKQYE